ncbi:histidine phosphatase family protein [Vagococcus xieshaowenii]|uniref:Histidine phosphatase family protein n=1 Tax=Vagococcus xieshaowenii TaxID=2562451 RepID=A0A4Z0DEM1_9ENTE|nr:histidine phosphatase family protein [Vagococcus xieshaowenii]QCA29255.1 histidine phosphatase family protein [Vagococcus xieshaowenii]TFZ43191.1 histidine phosphatase family protein [Vagococcus xieshaowenii]
MANNQLINIYLMRHGVTMLNTSNSVQGWADSPLTPDGERASEYAGMGLKEVAFDAVYSSDSGRAMQTAQHVMSENIATVNWSLTTEKGLRELCFGSFEGRSNDDLWEVLLAEAKEDDINNMDMPTFVDAMAYHEAQQRPSHANTWPSENYDMFTKRLSQSFYKIGAKALENDQRNILVVSHGLSIQAALEALTETPADFNHMAMNNSITHLQFDGQQFHLAAYNDTSYVEIGRQLIEE